MEVGETETRLLKGTYEDLCKAGPPEPGPAGSPVGVGRARV